MGAIILDYLGEPSEIERIFKSRIERQGQKEGSANVIKARSDKCNMQIQPWVAGFEHGRKRSWSEACECERPLEDEQRDGFFPKAFRKEPNPANNLSVCSVRIVSDSWPLEL